jgi:small subunit ribosomal protein S20
MANPAEEKEKSKQVKRSSAKKRQLQNEKRRIMNKAARSCIRTKIRGFQEEIETLGVSKKAETLNEISSLLDKAAKKGLFTLNKASRLKSRIAARLNAKPAAA